VILVDTGPLVALFDPKDAMHDGCASTLKTLSETLCTTLPVLTEAFHLLDPGSLGASNLARFLDQGGAKPWFFDRAAFSRALELIAEYEDHPMDLADASLVVAAERLGLRRIWTLDRGDFETYRIRKGKGRQALRIVSTHSS
jgi:predicted nucleic acid-binding protein